MNKPGDLDTVKEGVAGGDAVPRRPRPKVRSRRDGAAVPLDIAIEGVQVCAAGMAVRHDLAALEQAVRREEVEYVVGLPGDGFETEVFFSDLGHEYVRINAEYTT